MCIIISKPAKRKMKSECYHKSFQHNKDGAGIAYVDDNELKVTKGIFNEEEFVSIVEALEDKAMIIHCRVATHGTINAENCHPFLIECPSHKEYKFAVAHNGQLAWRSTKKQSDTVCFIEDFLAPLFDQNPWFLDQPHCPEMLEKFIGTGNKLVIMRHNSEDKETDTWIINESAGWKNYGCWFSNTTYIWPRVKTNDNLGGYYGGVWADNYNSHIPTTPHQPHLPGITPPSTPATPLRTAAEIAESKKAKEDKHPVLLEFGDWIYLDNKYLNINPSYSGANKANEDQRARWKKIQFDRSAPKNVTPPVLDTTPKENVVLGLPSPQDPPKQPANNVLVPRDPGVLPDEKCKNLEHLDSDEIKKLRRLAADWFRKDKAYEMKGKKTWEMLEDLRFDLRRHLPHLKNMDDCAVDCELLRDGESLISDMEIMIERDQRELDGKAL